MNRTQRAYAVIEAGRSRSAQYSLHERVAAAFEHHREGRYVEAANGYQEVLAVAPNQPDALHLLGVLAHQLGDPTAAVGLIERSIDEAHPNPDALNNLGNAYLALGDAQSAEGAYRRGILASPDRGDLHYNLANVLRQRGDATHALAEYDAAIALQPTAVAHFNRANLLLAEDEIDAAIESYRTALDLDPNLNSLLANMGVALAKTKRWQEAEDALLAAIARFPEDGSSYHNLGGVLIELDRSSEAIPVLNEALVRNPNDLDSLHLLARATMIKDLTGALEIVLGIISNPEARAHDWALLGTIYRSLQEYDLATSAYEMALQMEPSNEEASNNLGSAYAEAGRLDEARTFFEHRLTQDPANAMIHGELGLLLKDAGELSDGLEHMRLGLEIKPDPMAHSNYLFTLYYSNEIDTHEIRRKTEEWVRLYTPTCPPAPKPKPREGRKLRIGYVSADFHKHPAGYLYEAMFPLHDKERFEIALYVNQTTGDEVTANIVATADRWAMVKNRSDEELAQRIQEDEIDILIDLLGHTNNHRLTTFGLRPAPVQASWLGYFGTTGMPQMDYIVCDRITLPDEDRAFYSELPAAMPNCMYVFQPPKIDVQPGEPPMAKNGYITFGCFNNPAKITPEVIALWCQVLKEVPDSKLILNRWPFRSRFVQARFHAMFVENGIAADRIEFRATKGREAYFQSYQEVDVMLDTFPFGGGTTTSEALWMGVPVVSLPAPRLVGRMTDTILEAVGMGDLRVSSPDEFVALAAGFASDLDCLASLRRELRAKVEGSSLCDLATFTRELEGLYEWMFDQAVLRA